MTTEGVPDKGPVGLGGWLILPILGLFATIVMTARGTLEILPVIEQVQAATDMPAGLLEFLWIEVAANLLLILIVVWTMILLFRKSRLFPNAYIFFLIFAAVVVIGDTLVAHYMFDVELDNVMIRDAARSVIVCMIWIPYMLVSVRVKNTFVN